MSNERPAATRLVLGGHSFIAQLGSDPPATDDTQYRIVEECLDRGICRFDTTYQPERIALGNLLDALGRRAEAQIMAWSFFTDFDSAGAVGEALPYAPNHIDVILAQLRTSYVDCLVVLPDADAERDAQQVELVMEWQRRGYARSLAVWASSATVLERYRPHKAFELAIAPFNVTTAGASAIFASCKRAGLETLATSPFVRGWELDRMVAAAAARGDGTPEALRPVLADALLRFTLFQPDVDRVVVAMRKHEWVARNLESTARGPLSAQEHRWLASLRAPTPAKRRWWQHSRTK